MTALTMTADDMFDQAQSPMHRHLLLLAGVVAFVGVIGAGWGALSIGSHTPVARIQIEGHLQRLKSSDIDAALRPLVDREFGALDLDAARHAVEALPWTSRASVERVWPATVRVRVWERTPFAHWGDKALLDSDARVFTPPASEVPDGLPQLAGPSGAEEDVAQMFRTLSGELASSAFPLQGLTQDARGEWGGHTTDGVELRFGRTDPEEKVEMLRGPAERVLKNRMNEVKYVDLRYTNGFSVGWQDPSKSDSTEGR
ncbi:cell division protein FtsQ/DivIB [Solimonas terrae]|uniref:Cell division protein FtsQ n=1 Tax=Solimonas terrae TaxID=1396819 RepID=A0A6M2BUA9_9GAMM|nr:cell division protein FtsQ/DivIB [Solimonas terrae]NGY05791.1 FtsQ-type POTRA domain-containing protein [Solimonas terrae]